VFHYQKYEAQAYETQVGPIRSARTYYIDWASEYIFPLYVHVGGAHASDGVTDIRARAKEQIVSYGWGAANDLDQAGIGFPTFWRDYERLGRTVATEHTMYSTTENLWEYAADKRGYTNEDPDGEDWIDDFEPWKFEDELDLEDRGSIDEIDVSLSDFYWLDCLLHGDSFYISLVFGAGIQPLPSKYFHYCKRAYCFTDNGGACIWLGYRRPSWRRASVGRSN